MHNDAVHTEYGIRVVRPFVALTAATVLLALLTACGGNGDPEQPADGEPEATGTSSAEPTEATEAVEEEPYLPVPEGVELTPQGSMLAIGDAAVVAFEPRQDLVGVLDVKVTKVERTTIKESFSEWLLDKKASQSAPYFVRAKVTNTGDTDLGGRPVPLYVVDGFDRLVEPTGFTEEFEPCPDGRLPTKFSSGDTTKVCLVYMAPDRGELTAVSFRPEQEFDPITWTGEIVDYKPGKPKGSPRQGQ